MNSSYNFEYVYSNILGRFNSSTIITHNIRRSYDPPEKLDEIFDSICSKKYNLIYQGKDGDYLIFDVLNP